MEPLDLVSIALLLFLSAVFSGSEIGYYSLSRVKLRYRLRQGERRARWMEAMLQAPGPTIITILIGNNLAAQAMVVVSEQTLADMQFSPTLSVALTVLVLTPLVLIVGEFLPKHLFRRNTDRWMYEIVYFLTALRWLLIIPVTIIQLATALFRSLIPGGREAEIWEPHTSRPNLRTFLKAEGQGHNLSRVQQQVLDRVLALERVNLRYEGVTKPLSTIATIDDAATVAAVRTNLGPKFYQRYLVRSHEDGRPIGYVTAVDLVTAEDTQPISSLVVPLPEIAADTPMHEALQRMHDAGVDLALVPDAGPDEAGVTFRGDCLRTLVTLD